MKRSIITGAVALSLLAGTGAFAQNTATTTPAPRATDIKKDGFREIKADFQEKRTELKTDMKEDRAAWETKLKERREALQKELQAKREALKEEFKKRHEALKAEIEKVKKERAVVRKGYVEQKLRQVVAIITEKQARVQKAIDALEEKGLDTDEAQKHLDESKVALKTATEKLEAMAKAVVTDTDVKPLEAARKLAKEAEEALKNAREHLIAAIQELKALNSTDDDKDEDEKDNDSNN